MSTGANQDSILASKLDTEEAALWVAMRQGDFSARGALMEKHLPYAKVVAATYYARRVNDDVGFEEYHQLARLGLLESIDRFDPERGVQFRTFAARRMHGAILDGLEISTEKNQQLAARRRVRQDRLAEAKSAAIARTGAKSEGATLNYLADVGVGLALGILLAETGMYVDHGDETASAMPSPEVSYFRKTEVSQLRQRLRELMGALSAQERMVLYAHYIQEQPFDRIAADMGVTRGRVSQVHRSALSRMQESFGPTGRTDISF